MDERILTPQTLKDLTQILKETKNKHDEAKRTGRIDLYLDVLSTTNMVIATILLSKEVDKELKSGWKNGRKQ